MNGSRTRWWKSVAVVAAVAMVGASCSDGGGDSSDTTAETEETAAPQETGETRPEETEPEETEPEETVAEPTTTPPATAPPTLPTTTTSVPDEAGGVSVLEETFDDDSNGWAPDEIEDDLRSGEIADGFLSISQSGSVVETLAEGEIAAPSLLWPNELDEELTQLEGVRVETTVALTRGASAGLACGIDPTDEDPRSYSFTLSSSGVVSITEVAADGALVSLARLPESTGDADPALPEDPAFDYDPASSYELAIECRYGSTTTELMLELDGEVLVTTADFDDPVSGGTVGVTYGESALLTELEGFTPFGIVFDRVDVVDLGEGSSEGVLIDETFDDDSNQWGPVDSDFTTGEITDGTMTFRFLENSLESPDDTVFGELYWPSVLDSVATGLTDVRAETSVQMGRGGVAGVICGLDPTGADLRYYEVVLASSGVVLIDKYEQDGSVTRLARLPEQSSNTAGAPLALPDDPAFDYSEDATYDFAAECRLGDDRAEITLQLDGETMLTAVDDQDPITNGTVGISYTQSRTVEAVEGFTPFDVVFDEFVATRLPPKPQNSGARIVFDDSFDDDSDPNAWEPELGNDEFTTGAIADGALVFSATTSFLESVGDANRANVQQVLWWATAAEDITSALDAVRIETVMSMGAGAAGGVSCGIDTASAVRYDMILDSSGHVMLTKRQASGGYVVYAQEPRPTADPAPTLPPDPAYDFVPGTTYRLAAECHFGEDSNRIVIEVDGRVVIDTTDIDPIPPGVAGVNFGESKLVNRINGFQPFDVVFTDFTVSDLGDASGSSEEPSTGAAFTSECADGTDDMSDEKGNPLPGEESFGVDLAAVRLVSDGSVLHVEWELAQPAPTDASDTPRGALLWEIQITDDEGSLNVIQAILEGTEARGQLRSFDPGGERLPLELTISGNLVSVDVPLDETDLVPSSFTWTATGQVAPGFLDRCPGETTEAIAVG